MFEFIKKLFLWLAARARALGAYSLKLLQVQKIQNTLSHTFHLDQRLVFGLGGKKIPSLGQMKYFFRLLKKEEKKALLVFILIFVFSFGFLSFRFYLEHRIFVPAYGGEYAEALIGAPRNLNPLYAHANPVDADLSALVFSGLACRWTWTNNGA